MLDILSPVAQEKMDARSLLLRIAYLMYLAKRDEGAACGGDTFGAAISSDGGFALIEEEEIRQAEELAKRLQINRIWHSENYGKRAEWVAQISVSRVIQQGDGIAQTA